MDEYKLIFNEEELILIMTGLENIRNALEKFSIDPIEPTINQREKRIKLNTLNKLIKRLQDDTLIEIKNTPDSTSGSS